MSPKITTSAGTNPLNRKPLTPAEYATLHHALQAKASRLLQDLNTKLELELRQAHEDALRQHGDLAADVEAAEAEVVELERRRKAANRKAHTMRSTVAAAEARMEALIPGYESAQAILEGRDDAIKSVEDLTRELGVARREEKRVKGLLNATRGRTANLVKFIEDGEDEGAKRLLAMDNELADRRRKKREATEAALTGSTPLAG